VGPGRESARMNPNDYVYSPPSAATGGMLPASSSAAGMADRNAARLGPGLRVKGEITGNDDLVVEGSVEGLIQLDERKLTIGANAKVTADLIAREVVVYGSVKGNLRARDRIEIRKDGSVVGDLVTSRIMIEDGAYGGGSIEIDKTAESAGSGATPSRPSARAATSVSSQ
jgi:cytoskeletal protein CcmA (bactofilin family)